MPALRPRLRHPDHGLALLQRLRHAPGALQSLHRRAGDLRLAAAQRPSAADLRGRPAAARLRPRARRRPRLPGRARAARGRRPGDQRRQRGQPDGRGGRPGARRGPSAAPTCSRRSPAATGPATSATASPTSRCAASLLGFEPAGGFRRRACASSPSGSPARWRSTASTRPPPSWRGGGWWHEQPAPVPRRDPSPVLITGGAGFLGANIADRLAGEGVPVLIFDSLARPGVERNLAWLKERHGGLISVSVARHPRRRGGRPTRSASRRRVPSRGPGRGDHQPRRPGRRTSRSTPAARSTCWRRCAAAPTRRRCCSPRPTRSTASCSTPARWSATATRWQPRDPALPQGLRRGHAARLLQPLRLLEGRRPTSTCSTTPGSSACPPSCSG